MNSIFAIAFAAILVCAPIDLRAEVPAGGFAATTLELTASGQIDLPPDVATITLGVNLTEGTAGEAIRANAARMAQVVAAVKAEGVADRDIRTSQLSLSAQYADTPSGPPRLTGYQASNQVDVQVHDLTNLGRVVDAVVAAGADSIGQLSFGLANPGAAEDSARVAAVKALEDKAALYARATGYRIGRLVNLSEGGGYRPGPPMPMMAMAARANIATPIESGQITVRIEVSGLFELTR
ncbi:MAG TPA: SIMPL domain-containing protein [Caulobacteraceae bacterium]|nr:SIMPL domain-containing protein [Caulobacteraceae bacterium]